MAWFEMRLKQKGMTSLIGPDKSLNEINRLHVRFSNGLKSICIYVKAYGESEKVNTPGYSDRCSLDWRAWEFPAGFGVDVWAVCRFNLKFRMWLTNSR